jgi:hypothetical protein
MIDRGALVVTRPTGAVYRGVHRASLDATHFTGRKGKELAARYREAIVAGEGVLEDLDEAIELRNAAEKIGIVGLEVIVFEVPQEPPPPPRGLPIAPVQPAEGLVLLGWDVIEVIEPFWSPLTQPAGTAVNEHGLLADRATADGYARTWNAAHTDDDPLVAVRVWAQG